MGRVGRGRRLESSSRALWVRDGILIIGRTENSGRAAERGREEERGLESAAAYLSGNLKRG